MSDKEPPNPFEEIQKQLRELFKDSNVKVSAHGFDDSETFNNQADSEPNNPKDEDLGEKDDPLAKIRDFRLKPKEIRDYLDRYVIRQQDAKRFSR